MLLHRPLCNYYHQKEDLGFLGPQGIQDARNDSTGDIAHVTTSLPQVVETGPSHSILQERCRWPGCMERHQLITNFPVDSGTLCVARKRKTEIKSSPNFCSPENEIYPLRICLDDSVSTG